VNGVPAHANPFRVSRLHALPYRAPGFSWEAMLNTLRAFHYRGAIVGPHGHGKTTLLLALGERLEDAGFATRYFRMNPVSPFQGASARAFLHDIDAKTILLFDGAEQLGLLAWRRLLSAASRGAGLVVTMHAPCALPTLHRCETSERLMLDLLDDLLGANAVHVRDAALGAYRAHHGNVRAALLNLYDRWAAGHAPPVKRRACPARRPI